ncbi:oligosaccharide flippase family protein [Paenibacillus sp. JSM ZJ436]|uniref:oligosaccharide flippase family protein n=1 Tax=Paenibacillus sp. JSM ZJ436 TaxID=3376190 RepID=UPI0037A44946
MKLKLSSLSESIKNVGKISTGTVLGQIISIITLPLFTRMYGPVVIGNWALFMSIAIIVRSISDLGLTNAIMMEDSEEAAEKIYKVVTTISLILSIIIGLSVYTEMLSWDFGLNSLFAAIMLTLLIFTTQQIQICYTWLNRRKQYDLLMKNPIINNLAVTIIALTLGILGFYEYGYYLAMVMGQIITLMHMRRYLPKEDISIRFNIYQEVFKRHNRFIIYQMPSNILLQLKGQFPTLLINIFFNATILGYYTIAMRVLGMPITFLANSLGKVFFQKASEIKRKGDQVGEFTLRCLKKSMKLSLIPIISMLCVGDIGMILLFGDDFIVSANLLRVMTLYGFFLFLSMSVNGIAIVIDKQNYLMISGIFQLVGIYLGMWLGVEVFNNIYISVLSLGICFSIVQVVYFCFIFRITNVKIHKYLKPLTMQFVLILLAYALGRSILLSLGIIDTL